MPRLALVFAILASLLAGAHFLRSMELLGLAVSLLLPLLFVQRRTWARRVLQLAYIGAAALWLRTGLAIRSQRLALGEDWLRMLLILGAVALLSLVPALLLEGPKSRAWFQSVRK